MKKNKPKPRKQKKPRPKVVGHQNHSKGPGSGSIVADKIWGAIKRAQPDHRERTFGEMMDRCNTLPHSGIFHPEYEAHDCVKI